MSPERIEVESLREVGIYLNMILNKLEEQEEDREAERRERVDELRRLREEKSKRIFVLVSAFIAPLVLTFVYNAAGLGKF